MNVSWLERGVLLHNLLNAHSLPVAVQDSGDTNPRVRNDGLSSAPPRVFLDIAVIQFAHERRPLCGGQSNHRILSTVALPTNLLPPTEAGSLCAHASGAALTNRRDATILS